jgi:hypothetical protein
MMKFDRFAPFVFVVAVLSVVSFSVTESAADEGYEGEFDVDWGHEPGNGPGKWGVADPGWTLFNEELGQSPIDLANLGAIELPKIESHSPSDLEVAESNQEGVESSGTAPAPAQGAEPAGSETTNGDKPESANDDRPLIKNTYASFTIGSGITHIDESEHRDDQKQQFKSFDLRFGQHFRRNWRVDFIHANEGNPYNHHRDGFAVQATYLLIPSNKIRFEFGTGPYMSFDTTVDEETGEELNEKRGGTAFHRRNDHSAETVDQWISFALAMEQLPHGGASKRQLNSHRRRARHRQFIGGAPPNQKDLC